MIGDGRMNRRGREEERKCILKVCHVYCMVS